MGGKSLLEVFRFSFENFYLSMSVEVIAKAEEELAGAAVLFQADAEGGVHEDGSFIVL